jgi:hypothetical protein
MRILGQIYSYTSQKYRIVLIQGNVYEVYNATWSYCALIPPINADMETGKLMGLNNANDWTDTYDNTFGLSDNYYKILTVCILEVRKTYGWSLCTCSLLYVA